MQFVKELPDPFLMNDGNRVDSIEKWRLRRKEIKNLILSIEYGTMPGKPDIMKAETVSEEKLDDELFHKQVKLTFIPRKECPEFNFSMDVSIKYPFQECIDERKKLIPDLYDEGFPCMIYVGNTAGFELLEAGYLVICFSNNQLEPMEMGNPIAGPARRIYEELEPGKYSWGSIAVWAWGAMRVLDYVLERKDIDPNKIILSGHSRNGKTALLAGALDERFPFVAPAGSGCAGVGSYLAFGEGAETIASLTDRRRWWAWMHKDFEQYAYEFRNESKKKLPLDQHFVMGLVAPRPLLRMEGSEDYWANPEGTCIAFLATEPIYEYLEVPDNNQLFIRSGGHFHGHDDFLVLIDVADHYFYGTKQKRIYKDLVSSVDKLKKTNKLPKFFNWSEMSLTAESKKINRNKTLYN